MGLAKHAESHLDHVPVEVVEHVLRRYRGYSGGFFIQTFDLPAGLPMLEDCLYGPSRGDDPVLEDAVSYSLRGSRTTKSRMVGWPKRSTSVCTVVAGPSERGASDCVIYTVYGGTPAPREPDDPSLDDAGREESRAFWSVHALAR